MQPDRTRWAVDAALATVVAGLGVAEALVPFSTVTGHGSAATAAALAATAGIALVLRRGLPLVTLLAVLLPLGITAHLVDFPVLFWGGLVPMAVAIYSVARHGPGEEPRWGLVIAAAGLLAFTTGNGMIARPGELFFPVLVLAAAWTTGRLIHRKESAATTFELRAVDAEARSQEQSRMAIAAERTRIARELHDVVAHSVTAIVVQAGAARDVVHSDPDYARASLDRIRETGAEALDEMRRVVALLRDTGEPRISVPDRGWRTWPRSSIARSRRGRG
jgi:signal transduction histidine kinase